MNLWEYDSLINVFKIVFIISEMMTTNKDNTIIEEYSRLSPLALATMTTR